MVIRIRSETDLLDDCLLGVTFYLLQFLLLLVNKLVIVYHPANRRNCVRRDFNKVQFLLLCYSQGIFQRIYSLFNVITYKANFLSSYKLVNVMFGFLFLKRWPWSS